MDYQSLFIGLPALVGGTGMLLFHELADWRVRREWPGVKAS